MEFPQVCIEHERAVERGLPDAGQREVDAFAAESRAASGGCLADAGGLG